MPNTAFAASAVRPAYGEEAVALERLTRARNLLQLVQMRWMAVLGQVLTILVVQYGLGIALPMVQMLTLLGVLSVVNLVSTWRARTASELADSELFGILLIDVAVLTGQLYFAGGSANPFVYLYLLQVVLGAVLMSAPYGWALVAVTSLCAVALHLWHWPLAMPGGEGSEGVGLIPYYFEGLVICFLINAALLVIFVGRIASNNRQRDDALARMRQQAAEAEHILRMGLLASGAAHELSTPLATLSVILGDWARMAPFAAEPELREEIERMQVQVDRCKRIVTGILQTAGEARAETLEQMTVRELLEDVLANWRQTRACRSLQAVLDDGLDTPIMADGTLRQMVDNVLDNALEANADGEIRVLVSSADDQLVIRVLDEGPGFPPAMLEQLGKPYQSTKGRPGSGLGLFLSVNVARTLGGRLEARNLDPVGAEVSIVLPMRALMPK
ncbi:ATP-binding protein [Variovorax sp. VNK109]|uniref:ATP-binding protein n=1 Tax=Variovorax sp. VNK109 TaxID=3400919 RepID=UPI003C023513